MIPSSVLNCPTGWEHGPHTAFAGKRINFIKPGQEVTFKIASKFPPGEVEEIS